MCFTTTGAHALRRSHPRPAGNWLLSNLSPEPSGMITADPPWLFQLYSEKGEQKSAQSHYDCMGSTTSRSYRWQSSQHATACCGSGRWARFFRRPSRIAEAWASTIRPGARNSGRWGNWLSHALQAESRSSSPPAAIRHQRACSKPQLADEKRWQYSQKPEQAQQLAERPCQALRASNCLAAPTARAGTRGAMNPDHSIKRPAMDDGAHGFARVTNQSSAQSNSIPHRKK